MADVDFEVSLVTADGSELAGMLNPVRWPIGVPLPSVGDEIGGTLAMDWPQRMQVESRTFGVHWSDLSETAVVYIELTIIPFADR